MKSLKRIQILVKICRVVCYILFACFIAGAAGCVLGMIILNFVKDINLGNGSTLTAELAKNGITINGCYAMMAAGIVGCGVGIFLSIYTAHFFKKVIDEGTPFKRPLIRELRIVGLVNVLVNIGASILIGIGFGIAKGIDPGIGKLNNYSGVSIVFGLVLLLLSLFIEYPVELEESNKPIDVQPEPVEEENKQ